MTKVYLMTVIEDEWKVSREFKFSNRYEAFGFLEGLNFGIDKFRGDYYQATMDVKKFLEDHGQGELDD